MRSYEEMFIVRPDITDEELDPFIESLRSVITNAQGTVDNVNKMGVRKLAYRVEKRAEGYYVLIQFKSEPTLVHELERRLRVSDLVMKFLTVRTDEKLKRDAKLQKKKEARAARRPARPEPAPALPVFPGEAEAVRPGLPQQPAPAAPAPAAPAPAEPALTPQES